MNIITNGDALREPSRPRELLDVGPYGFAQRVEVVTAFKTRNDAPCTRLVGPLEDRCRHRAKVIVGKAKLAERIVEMGVESGRDNDQIRLHRRRYFADSGFERAFLIAGLRMSLHRNVEGRADTSAVPGFAA